jgi:minor extracellular serine protease Vpr
MSTQVVRFAGAVAAAAFAAIVLPAIIAAMPAQRIESRIDLAVQKYGVTGRGVTIVVIDRGIDWRHPDFLKDDGTTRIRALLDMTGQNGCPATAPAIEYSEAQINAALRGGPAIDERDAVGHGTATAGGAAGNGRASNGQNRGVAPEADLIIVKAVSEGAAARGSIPAEARFSGCLLDALDWVDQQITRLGQPAVGIINSGTQWGPIDGTSVLSRKIDEIFNRRGRAYISPSGDEGDAADHAGGTFAARETVTVQLTSASTSTSYLSGWYSGAAAADIRISFSSGAVGPVSPNSCVTAAEITLCNYLPGREFYPWQSTSGDRAFYARITGHQGAGELQFVNPSAAGRFDAYGTIFNGYGNLLLGFTSHLVEGRLTDYSSTKSAIVVGDYYPSSGAIWPGSSGGPTRDGRRGVDLSAPGEGALVPLAANSAWAASRPPGTQYIAFGATSGSAPIVVGATALMLQMQPSMTAGEVRDILRRSSVTDRHTGTTPNALWGYGKLDVLAALDDVRNSFPQ